MWRNKREEIVLDCGVKATSWTYRDIDFLEISLIDLYEGRNDAGMDFKTLGAMFIELAEKGYEGKGLSREVGYYDSTDDLLLSVTRKSK